MTSGVLVQTSTGQVQTPGAVNKKPGTIGKTLWTVGKIPGTVYIPGGNSGSSDPPYGNGDTTVLNH